MIVVSKTYRFMAAIKNHKEKADVIKKTIIYDVFSANAQSHK